MGAMQANGAHALSQGGMHSMQGRPKQNKTMTLLVDAWLVALELLLPYNKGS